MDYNIVIIDVKVDIINVKRKARPAIKAAAGIGAIIMNEMDFDNYSPEIYTLTDDDGKEQSFELIDTYEDGENRYYAMIPYYENPDDLIQNNGELVILKSDYVGDEEMLVTIDDDDEYERIGKIFMERIEEMFEEMEDDGCDDDDCDCCNHQS